MIYPHLFSTLRLLHAIKEVGNMDHTCSGYDNIDLIHFQGQRNQIMKLFSDYGSHILWPICLEGCISTR